MVKKIAFIGKGPGRRKDKIERKNPSLKNKMENKDVIQLIKNTLMFNTDTESFEDSINWFENRRHEKKDNKTRKLFDELVLSQVGILFKILIDAKEVEIKDNVIRLNETSEAQNK